jgi:CRISPR-associated protein Cas1
MIKRTIEISENPAHLSVKDGQLLIRAEHENSDTGANTASNERRTVPLEDLGLVMVDQRGTTFSLSALAGIAEHGAALCVCSSNHLPIGLLLPLADRHETVWRIKDQFAASVPTKKRLWRQIVRAKILGQARNLAADSAGRAKLLSLRSAVKSGDSTNIEAQAAKVFWAEWLGRDSGFKRVAAPTDEGAAPNNFLNYGYAVVRAAVARAIVSAGLLPAIGIHHDSRSNPFCLADDLMEPLRPLVDRRARELFVAGHYELRRTAKAALLSVLTETMSVPSPDNPKRRSTGPLMVCLHRYVASFVACLPRAQRDQRLTIPVPSGAGRRRE